MDFTSALKPDIFRSFAIYICPGITAVAPWLYGVIWPDGLWRLLYGTGTLVSASILIFCGLTAGLILEELGGHIEMHLDEKLEKNEKTKGVSALFWLYLRTPSNPSIVADKFLSATVTRFKFELSMMPALVVAAVAFLKMTIENLPRIEWSYIAVMGLCAVGATYLYREACSSADLLHRLRESILFAHDVERATGKRTSLDTSAKPSAQTSRKKTDGRIDN